MSFRRLWGFLAVVLPVLGALLAPVSMVDLAYQLRAGNEILATGRVPGADTWTATLAGTPWLDQQWGAQVVLAAVSEVGGWGLLVLLRAALVGVAFGAILLATRARGAAGRPAAVLTILAFLLASPALALRPQLFGIALFAGSMWLLATRHRRSRLVWFVPVLAVLWANAHGSFILAPVLVGWAWVEDVSARHPRSRATFGLLLATLAATTATPFGPGAWLYALRLSTNADLAARVTEWQPPSVTDPVGAAFLLSVAVVAVVVVGARQRGRTLGWPSLALLAGFAFLGVRAVRGLAWWPLAAAVALAPLAARATSGLAPVGSTALDTGDALPERPAPAGVRRANGAVAALLVAVCVLLAGTWLVAAPGPASGRFTDAPAGVTDALRLASRPGDPVFHPQPWGSWVSFAVPEVRIFVDSRIELVPPAVWAAYDTVAAGAPGWQDVLDRYDISFVLVAPEDEALASRMRTEGWPQRYAGPDGWLFERVG